MAKNSTRVNLGDLWMEKHSEGFVLIKAGFYLRQVGQMTFWSEDPYYYSRDGALEANRRWVAKGTNRKGG